MGERQSPSGCSVWARPALPSAGRGATPFCWHMGCTTATVHVDNCHGADALPVQLSSVPKSGILQNRSEDGAEFFRRLLQFSEGS